MRRGRALGLSLLGLFVSAAIAGYAFEGNALAHASDLARVGQTPGPDASVLSVIAVFSGLGCLLVGSLVVARRPRHPVGWLLLFTGTGWVVFNGATYLAYTEMPQHRLIGEIALVVWAPGVALTGAAIVLLLAFFPAGTIARGWRRAAAGLLLASVLCDVAACLVRIWLEPSGDRWFRNPIGLRSVATVSKQIAIVTPFVIVVLALVMAVDLVVRWLRSSGVERQQMKFLGLAVVVEIPLLVVLVSTIPSSNGWEAWFFTALTAFALAIGFAIIRLGLWDIDRVISRTVAYVIVTGLVVSAYIGLVTLATQVLGFSSAISVAASTLIAAALFAPLRRRAQAIVDRRFNRARYDAQLTLAEFASRLRDLVDTALVRSELSDTIGMTLDPSTVAVWVRPPARR